MVATFLTLCNSACITCIWCFLLSICFPNFVKIMEETESDECWHQKEKAQRGSFDSVTEIKRREFEMKRREEGTKSQKERRDFIDPFNRRPDELIDVHSDEFSIYKRPRIAESLDSVNVKKNRKTNQNFFVDQSNRYERRKRSDSSRNDCRIYRKLSRVASGLEERFFDGKNQSAKQFRPYRRSKCHECNDSQSRLHKNL